MDVCDLEHGATAAEEVAEEQATNLPASEAPAPVPGNLAAPTRAAPAAEVLCESSVAAGDAPPLAPVD